MNAAAAETFARGYLAGFFDVVSALTGGAAAATPESPAPLTQPDWTKTAAACTLTLRTPIKDGGAIAVLLPADAAAQVFAAAMGDNSINADQIGSADQASLREVFEPCLGGGVSHFKEKYGVVLEIASLELAIGPGDVAALKDALGQDACAVAFAATVGSSPPGRGVLLFSTRFETIVPTKAATTSTADTGGTGVGESLNPEDVNEILREIPEGSDVEPPRRAKPVAEKASTDSLTRNLDMVLDIRLVATARLGRVEMPISEILSLGPGSIIEVGHLVDEPVELLVNDKLIARGDVVVVDEKFGLRITEIVSPRERIESLR